jgi:hypothetical protein
VVCPTREAVVFMSGQQLQQAVQEQPSYSSWLPFCQLLPKVELHAHLNGCVRSSTIRCGSSKLIHLALATLHSEAQDVASWFACQHMCTSLSGLPCIV